MIRQQRASTYRKKAGQHQPSGFFSNRSAIKQKLNCALPFRVSLAPVSFDSEVFTASPKSRRISGLAVDLFKPLIAASQTKACSAGR